MLNLNRVETSDSPDTAGSVEWQGVSYKTILEPAQSGGAMSIVDSVSPVGSGPPLHVHHAEDEAFVLLSGACRVLIGGQETIAKSGESVFVPRGTPHTFKVIGNEPCRHLIILTPGGFEGFFTEMARGQFQIPEDMPAIEQSAMRHNLTFTGPPLE